MNIPRYLEDCYLKELETKVRSVKDGKFIVFEDTIFYPNSGGQLYDTGKVILRSGNEEFSVVFTGKFSGEISHEVDKEGLSEGDPVLLKIDWDRRYRMMRYHTAAHILSRMIINDTGALVSGNQLGLERSRIDFNLENYDKEKMMMYAERFNSLVDKNLPVKTAFMSRDEALKIPELFQLKDIIPDVDTLRIVDIEGFDRAACGGTHVKNTSEIGHIKIIKTENKGKNNRRLYFRLVE